MWSLVSQGSILIYTYGRKVTVHNDHKPLATVLKRPVEENPIRLQKMLCRIMGYYLDFKYIKVKDMLIADALSRSHVTNHTRSQSEEEIETIGLVIQDQSVTSHLKEIAEETAKDNVLQSVIHHISENWSISKRCLPMDVHPFWSCKDQLSFNDGIIYSDRIVVLATLRKSLPEKLHQAHMGVESTLRRARRSLWWPGMNSQLKQSISSCQVCQSFQRNNPKESLMSHLIPDRPWSKIAADFSEFKGGHYLVLVDYYSDIGSNLKR